MLKSQGPYQQSQMSPQDNDVPPVHQYIIPKNVLWVLPYRFVMSDQICRGCATCRFFQGSTSQTTVVTSSCWQFLVVVGSYLLLVVVIGIYWQFLVVNSSYWYLLVVSGSYQQLLVVTSNSNCNKLLYLHGRIILQYCKSMHMTIKIQNKQH